MLRESKRQDSYRVARTVFIGIGVLCLLGAKSTAKQRISFRTSKPIAGHYHSSQEAATTEKTLKQIGCETKRSQHDGHIDLTYECQFWRSLTLSDAKEVANWNKWLTAKGFSVVTNTPAENHPEAVKYRLAAWRTLHFDAARDAKAHVAMFKMLGCEVTMAKHNGHEDVKFRCPSWKALGVSTHQEAHGWMQALKKYGFATLHEH